jgi:hypothetical protein
MNEEDLISPPLTEEEEAFAERYQEIALKSTRKIKQS